MKLIKLSLATAMAVTFAYAEETSDLGFSANVTATSNYIWRGMTQTADSPAVQGGFDLDYKGLYLGVWGSNVEFGDAKASLEADIYLGYAGSISNFSYDIGFVEYMYPNQSNEYNFGEAYLSLGYDFEVVSLSAKYALGVDTDDVDNEADNWEPENNWEVGASVPLPMDISIDATYGDYDSLGAYYLVGVNKSFDKFDLTLAYTANDGDGITENEQDNVVVSISSSF
ncbi:MAG: TorF family putative porin [Campylobacterota bacterium]|nr:TorF family putative porin [Campylobacterota bacterium]